MRVTYHKGALQGIDLANHCRDMTFAEFREAATAEDLLASISDSDVLAFNNPLYTSELAARLAEQTSRVRLIQLSSTGYDALIQHGVPEGVAVSNAAGVWAPIVAEHACALVLSFLRGIHRAERDRSIARWDRPGLLPWISSLEGTRVGILGFGAIGAQIARRMKPFDVEIIAIVRRDGNYPGSDKVCLIDDVTEQLPELDILVNALPQTPATTGLVDAGWFRRMKPSALFVNVGRGGTVDQKALHEALQMGSIAGAAIDVAEVEPMPGDDPLWTSDRLIVSPHLAAFGSRKGLERLLELCRDNVTRLNDGRPLVYPVSIQGGTG